nr:hypothetical protein [Candidatus Pelagibacter sp.]
MPFPPDISDTQKYSNVYNLDEIDVLVDTDIDNPMYLDIKGVPDILTLGKHYGTISFKDIESSPYYLKEKSYILFEVKDSEGTIIFSDLTTLNDINGAAVFYIWVKQDPLRTYEDIENGPATLTFVGELSGVPNRWKGVYNYRCTYPIEIRKDLPNKSPILFQDLSGIQLSSSFSESIELDTNETEYKRSYLNISASHLHTYGGKVEYIEASYRETRAQNNEYKVLTIYPLSSSAYEITGSSAGGLNPISDLQKFPMPWDLRRKGNVDFRLRFLNANSEYAQDITQNNVNIEITGSITGFTGSKVIIDTDDGMHVTGSGKLLFGKSLDDGVHMFAGTDNAGKQTVKYDLYEGGTKIKTVFTIGEVVAVTDITSSGTINTTGSISVGEISSSGGASLDGNLNFSGKLLNTTIEWPGDLSEDVRIFIEDPIANQIWDGKNMILRAQHGKRWGDDAGDGGDIILHPGDKSTGLGGTSGQVLISGSNLTVEGSISASGDISASGLLYISASHGDPSKLLLAWDSSSKQVYYTSSLAFGGGGGSADNLGNHTATQDLNLDGNDIYGVQHITASGNISSSGNIIADGIKATLPAGVDNSVVILDADGFIKTDEIDERVWSGGQLLSGDGGALIDGYIPVTSDGGAGLLDTSNLRWDSNKLGIGVGAITPPKPLTVQGDISSSGDLLLEDGEYIFWDNPTDQYTYIGEASNKMYIYANNDLELNSRNHGIEFAAGGSSKMYMSSSGYFQIGGSPGSSKPIPKPLTVEGDISASGDFYLKNSKDIRWNNGFEEMRLDATNGRFNFLSSSTNILQLSQSNGSSFLGIGTTNP